MPQKLSSIPSSLLVSAMLISIHSFGGRTKAYNVGNEIKDPIKPLGIAALVSYLSIFVLLNAMIPAYLAIIPHEDKTENGKLDEVLLFSKDFERHSRQKDLLLHYRTFCCKQCSNRPLL